MRLAWRIAAYDGMMSRRIEAQNHKPNPGPAPSRRPATRPASADRLAVGTAPAGVHVVPAAAMALMHGGLIERVQVPKTES